MKMAMGYLDVPVLLDKGIAVGIGTDAPACNNSNDLFGEIKTAALLHKHHSGRPDVLSANLALRMGTSIGARSIFADDILGTLEVGKRADFISVDLDFAAPLPLYNLPSSVVYSLCGRDVRDVFVDGKQLVKNGISLIYDEEKIRSDASQAMMTLLKRANL
jgi:5-methylthioadenosine/S-adenosylhomocysteine deaminase